MKKILFAMALLAMAPALKAGNGGVVLGDEQFSSYLPMMKGSRIAVFSNHTGIVGDKTIAPGSDKGNAAIDPSLIPFGKTADGKDVAYGPHLVDVLLSKNINITAILSPEHGFRGTADPGEVVKSGTDKETGIPILSLYATSSHAPDAETMSKFDILLIDIQDVGLRYYTYYITMYHLMDACSEYGKKVILLDRPNPNGFYVDGPILDMKYKSGVGWLPIPIVHGMTLGELALMINGEGWLENGRKCDLTVIACKNYTHKTKYRLIVPPSPNLKDMKAIYLYASTCFFEGTLATPAKGTSFPFEAYGSPEMKSDFNFTPKSIPGAKSPLFENELCHGKDLRGICDEEIWKKGIDLSYIIEAYGSLGAGDRFFGTNNHFEQLVGNGDVRKMIEEGKSAEEIKKSWKSDVENFLIKRKPYLLYPE